MLGKIFGSNTRVKILKLFLLHPGERYYIRQLARRLRLQVNSVRRELENLEKFGLLISSPVSAEAEGGSKGTGPSRVGEAEARKNKHDKKYYQANTDFVLYEEIKALIIKAQILYEKDFIEKLGKAGRPRLLILSGIFVNNPASPVDLLIVGRFNRIKLLKLIKELEDELGKEINFTLMDWREFKYRRDITDVFLYEILEGKNMVVIDDGALC